MPVLAYEGRGHRVLVDLEDDRPCRCRRHLVIEDRDRSILAPACIVLEREGCAGPHPEVAPLAAEPPQDLAGLAIDLVDGRGVPGGHEQLAVVVDLDRVGVQVVVHLAGGAGRRDGGFGGARVVDGVPFPDQPAGPDIDLLDRAIQHLPRRRAAGPEPLRRDGCVGEQERGARGGELQLVQVRRAARGCGDAIQLAVRRIRENVLTGPDAGPADGPFPPGQDRPACVLENPEIGDQPVDGRPEPHRLARRVDDQPARALSVVRGQKDESGRGGGRARRRRRTGRDRDERWADVGSGAIAVTDRAGAGRRGRGRGCRRGALLEGRDDRSQGCSATGRDRDPQLERASPRPQRSAGTAIHGRLSPLGCGQGWRRQLRRFTVARVPRRVLRNRAICRR